MTDSIKAAVKEATKAAMRAKQKERLVVIRMISAEFKRVEVDERIEVDDTRALVLLDKMLKQRKDSLTQYQAAGRDDLANAEAAEIEVIQSFLPTPLTDAEINALVAAAVDESGASSMRDMGKVMAIIKPQAQGRADMGSISKLIKAALTA